MHTFPVLIDLDGVLKIGNKPADYVKEFLLFLTDEKIPAIILSNSTLSSSSDIKKFFLDNNIKLGIPVMTTVDATLNYISEFNKKISLYCNEKIKNLFVDFIDDEKPNAVVIGDLGENWSYDILNDIFRKVINGAEIIAMQKNKFWTPPDSDISLDAGAFVAAIEFAASKNSFLIGKPSPVYFQTALKELGFNKDSDFFMVGDDVETDIMGAQSVGGKGILVYTGKTKKTMSKGGSAIPDFEAENLKEVISIIKNAFS
ncbi:MAG: HAD-IIA family hydrolase [Ignavibacteriaceae bacterium]